MCLETSCKVWQVPYSRLLEIDYVNREEEICPINTETDDDDLLWVCRPWIMGDSLTAPRLLNHIVRDICYVPELKKVVPLRITCSMSTIIPIREAIFDTS